MKKIFLTFALFWALNASAETPENFLQNLKEELSSQGVKTEWLEAGLEGQKFPYPGLEVKITNQPEFTFSFSNYLNRLVSAQRVSKGQQLFNQHREKLLEIEQAYNIPAHVVTALWGIETNYGSLPGNYPIVPVLATHVYNDYRTDFFTRELVAALKILEQGHITPEKFTGSWAGAMGQCQFMPTSFTGYSADGDNDGKRDIWTNEADVFASAANYLKKHGWQNGQIWGQRVYLSKILPKIQMSERGLGERESIAYWQSLGVKPVKGELPASIRQARLFLPYGPSGKAYLVYDNFDVILKWNRSSAFAFSVLTLADKINEVR